MKQTLDKGYPMTQANLGDTVVIHYTVRLDDASVFSTSTDGEPLRLRIGQGRTIPALEEAIVGMKRGQCKTLTLTPAEAYGLYHEALVKRVHRHKLAEGLEPEVGQRLKGTRMDGQAFLVTVMGVSEKSVTLDANHPLAGKDLTFDIQLIEIT